MRLAPQVAFCCRHLVVAIGVETIEMVMPVGVGDSGNHLKRYFIFKLHSRTVRRFTAFVKNRSFYRPVPGLCTRVDSGK